MPFHNQRMKDRTEFIGRFADPSREGGAIQVDSLAAVNLCLAIQWQVIRIFADKNMRHRCLCR